MLVAKCTALVGLLLLIGGAGGSMGVASQAVGAFLLLLAAAVAAVVLEGRDLDLVSGLDAHPLDDTEAAVRELVSTPTADEHITSTA